jgi:hypothetical protein
MNGGGHPTFPTEWGADCPPADANNAELTVYRAVRTDPPGGIDFLTLSEQGRPIRGGPAQVCKSRGVSVMLTRRDAEHYCVAFPAQKCVLVACATLTADHGKTKLTPSTVFPSHVTWWAHEGLERQSIFEVV